MSENRPPGCENCKNPCTIHLTQIVDGVMHKVDLCANCPNAKNVDDPTGFSIADQLLGLGAGEEMGAGDSVCPTCGFTQSDFKKLGRLGCADCYETFEEGLSSLLRNMHRGIEHKGKAPAKLRKQLERAGKLEDLKKNLASAVQEERYEEAASLRDKISKLQVEI